MDLAWTLSFYFTFDTHAINEPAKGVQKGNEKWSTASSKLWENQKTQPRILHFKLIWPNPTNSDQIRA